MLYAELSQQLSNASGHLAPLAAFVPQIILIMIIVHGRSLKSLRLAANDKYVEVEVFEDVGRLGVHDVS